MNAIKSLFPEWSPDLLSELTSRSTRRKYREGSVILHPGLTVQSTLLVTKGRIKICRGEKPGASYFLYYLLPGQVCALSMHPEQVPWISSITARAVEPAEVLVIPHPTVREWLGRYSCWNHFLLKTFQAQMSRMFQVMDLVLFKSLDKRLSHYLDLQRKVQNADRVHLSHKEIADDIASSREVISRLLKKMEMEGKIKRHRNQIEFIPQHGR